MDVQVEMTVECHEQTEASPDEVYVVSGVVRRNGGAVARCVWGGTLARRDAPASVTLPFEVWRGALYPGDAAAIIIILVEQDGMDYAPGIEFARQVARRTGGCLATISESEGLETLASVDYHPLVNRASSAFGCLKKDRLIGALVVGLTRHVDGRLKTHVHPIASAEVIETHRVRFSGENGVYVGVMRVVEPEV